MQDNAGLVYPLQGKTPVIRVFIFDKNILDELEDKNDCLVLFIYLALQEIQSTLKKFGSSLDTRYGVPIEICKNFLNEYTIQIVLINYDYEPYTTKRDAAIEKLLRSAGAGFHRYKDLVIFEKNEVIKDSGSPYTIFTPYTRKWKSILNDF